VGPARWWAGWCPGRSPPSCVWRWTRPQGAFLAILLLAPGSARIINLAHRGRPLKCPPAWVKKGVATFSACCGETTRAALRSEGSLSKWLGQLRGGSRPSNPRATPRRMWVWRLERAYEPPVRLRGASRRLCARLEGSNREPSPALRPCGTDDLTSDATTHVDGVAMHAAVARRSAAHRGAPTGPSLSDRTSSRVPPLRDRSRPAGSRAAHLS